MTAGPPDSTQNDPPMACRFQDGERVPQEGLYFLRESNLCAVAHRCSDLCATVRSSNSPEFSKKGSRNSPEETGGPGGPQCPRGSMLARRCRGGGLGWEGWGCNAHLVPNARVDHHEWRHMTREAAGRVTPKVLLSSPNVQLCMRVPMAHKYTSHALFMRNCA